METPLSHLKDYRIRLAALFEFSPYTGRLWLDLMLLGLAVILQQAILPTLTLELFPIDLITPWLVVGFVSQPLARSTLMLIIAALLVELHTAAPAGIYLCAFWVIAVTLWMVRSSLSWWHAFPWLVTFTAAELWVVFFEYFVRSIAAGSFSIVPTDLAKEALRVAMSVGLGMILCQAFMRAKLVEDD